MQKFRQRIFFVICCLLWLNPPGTTAQDRIKNVAIFFSYGPNLPAFEKILNGINTTLGGDTERPVNLMTEYLDLNRSGNDDYSKFIVNLYNDKVKQFPLDLLITIGPGINDAIQKYGSDELKELKMINVDLPIPGRTTLQDLGIKNGKEIILNFKPEKTLQQAFYLFPRYKEVIVLSGVSALDKYFTGLLKQQTRQFEPAYHFSFITGLNLDSAIGFLQSIPPESVVMVPAFLQDAAHVTFSTPEVLELFSQNCPAPVFLGITDGGFKGTGGGIGGYLFSYTNLGKELGAIVNKALDGKPMDQITVNENSFYSHIYDWNELERWDLTRSKAIPADSVFYNRHFSFFELYKWYLLGVFLFILSQTFLIVYLFRLNKRQKALAEKMRETEAMYRELLHIDRLSKMSILTASLSHELFQPLTAIRLTAQAAKQFEQAEKLDTKKALQLFEHILEDENRATKLIRNVKALMKPETIEMERVNLKELVLETVEIFRAEKERKGIRMSLKIAPEPCFVLGDKIQLQQVLMNFTRNASAAMENNGPRTKMLEIGITCNQKQATVSVRDTGPGLTPMVQANLFKPFTSTKKDGFGIGLTLCKSLIEKHHGRIHAENHPEGGAVFSFSLPLINQP